jgi:hypothetical protein
MTGTILGAEAAARAFIGVDVARTLMDFRGEVTGCSFQTKEIGVAQNLNIWRPTGLN